LSFSTKLFGPILFVLFKWPLATEEGDKVELVEEELVEEEVADEAMVCVGDIEEKACLELG